MTIGIGGAGSKIAAKLDNGAVLVNVSETELNKVPGGARRILASVHAARGQFKGSRKNPEIGHDAYQSVRRELLSMVRGDLVFSSTGGGTGNGITTGILDDLTKANDITTSDKTSFGMILPYAKLESSEFVSNTIEFLTGPLAAAIDSGNTGNIFLFSNKKKFEEKISEEQYNQQLVDSLRVFLTIPDKNDKYRLLDGHIDHEDFSLYMSKPYFNHFSYFEYDPKASFGTQLEANCNPYLLAPEAAIEALFLLEVPKGGDPTLFYDILQYFSGKDVSPIYSVVENQDRQKPFVTVSLLYSRKPAELLEDFNRISEGHVQAKVKKSLDQWVELPKVEVNMEKEARRAVKQRGDREDVLATLRRLGKL